MRTMLLGLGVVAVLGLAAPALAQPTPPTPPRVPRTPRVPDPPAGAANTERLTRTFTVRSDVALVLSNVTGDVVINGTTHGEVSIEAVKRATGRDDADTARQLEATRVQINTADVERGDRAGRIEVRTIPGARRNRVRVDYTISLPSTATVDVRSVSGDVKLSNVKGEVHAEVISGDLVVTGLGGPAGLKAVSGDVLVTSAAVDGELSVSSVSGDLTLKQLKARTLSATTISGTVTLVSVTADRAEVQTVNGDVDFVGSLVKGGRYEFTSHSGDVRLALDGKTGFDLEASTFSGDIKSDWPINSPGAVEDDGGYGPHHRTLRGSFGDGSAHLEISSFSGAIVLAKK